MEFINATEISPLINKCQVKVCYVGQKPNRNGTVITKELAAEMGKKLPGSPVVGRFNQETEDFSGHDREIVVSEDSFEIIDITKPYGFVPTDAKVWFQKFDDEGVEHEYLVTECYLWTDAYPECKRILDQGNNQSMELNKNSTGVWAKDNNSGGRIFIYNEALIEKLCILGESVEPCFEGAQIKTEFSLEDQFTEMRRILHSMAQDLHEVLSKGGEKVPTEYAVDIGCTLFDAIYEKLWSFKEHYRIVSIYEQDGQKFAVLRDCDNLKLFRLDFQYDEENGFIAADDLVEVTETFTVAATQYSAEDLDAYEAAHKKEEEEAADDEEEAKEEVEEEEKEIGEEPKKKYDLEEVVEYAELNTKYEALQNDYAALQQEKADLESELTSLREFKLSADRKEKQSMIDSFFMLTDEDKKDVVEHIDTYSLDDIEAKLSVICVRNKVDFNLNKDEEVNQPKGLFNLDPVEDDAPEWIKAVRETAKKL